jgi:hypothetical protein
MVEVHLDVILEWHRLRWWALPPRLFLAGQPIQRPELLLPQTSFADAYCGQPSSAKGSTSTVAGGRLWRNARP